MFTGLFDRKPSSTRTLIYVPMMHSETECMLTPQEKALRTKKMANSHEQFLGFFWMEMIFRVGNQLRKMGREGDFLLFSESWTGQKNWAHVQRNIRAYWMTFHGAESFLAGMMQLGGRPQTTEGHLVYTISGEMEKRRREREQKRNRSPLPNTDTVSICHRDRAIAANLDRLVPPGQVAVLCMGAAHDVPRYLDESWEVQVITHALVHDGVVTACKQDRKPYPVAWLSVFQQQMKAASKKEYDRVVHLPEHLACA